MFIRDDRGLSEQMRRKAKGVAKEGPSSPRHISGIFQSPMFMQTAFPVGNLGVELATLLQPVPINKNAMRCYSHKRDQDDEESMGTIEGQILDEEEYIL
jgi:hypothetical protein